MRVPFISVGSSLRAKQSWQPEVSHSSFHLASNHLSLVHQEWSRIQMLVHTITVSETCIPLKVDQKPRALLELNFPELRCVFSWELRNQPLAQLSIVAKSKPLLPPGLLKLFNRCFEGLDVLNQNVCLAGFLFKLTFLLFHGGYLPV